jgi:multidrug efflux pump subunit AcrB
VIRQTIPQKELTSIVDTLGLPYSGINLSYSNTGVIGTSDGDIFVTLDEDHHPTIDYVRSLRDQLKQKYPSVVFSFLPADIVGQILNFGAPAPIDVQVSSHDPNASVKIAKELYGDLMHVPGLVDVRIQQAQNLPQINVNVDRTRASMVGLTTDDVASNLLTALGGIDAGQSHVLGRSENRHQLFHRHAGAAISTRYLASAQESSDHQFVRRFWRRRARPAAIRARRARSSQNLASFGRSAGPAVVTHYSTRPPWICIYGSVDRTDLGSVAADVQRIVDATFQKPAARFEHRHPRSGEDHGSVLQG